MNCLSGSKRKSTNEEEELPSVIPTQLIGCEGMKWNLLTLKVGMCALGRAQTLEDPMTEGKWQIIKRETRESTDPNCSWESPRHAKTELPWANPIAFVAQSRTWCGVQAHVWGWWWINRSNFSNSCKHTAYTRTTNNKSYPRNSRLLQPQWERCRDISP